MALSGAAFVFGAALVTAGLLLFPSIQDEPGRPAPPAASEEQGATRDDAPPGVPGTAHPVPAEAVPGVSYVVPEVQPWAGFRLQIEALGVNARVVQLDMDERRVPQVPHDASNVAWYEWSSLPGEGSNAVFAGHVRWGGNRGIFADLKKLSEGDIIRVKWDDGRELVYEVVDNFDVRVADRHSLQVMAPTPSDTLTLITCGGRFVADSGNPLGGDFSDRTVVRARLLEASVGAGASLAFGFQNTQLAVVVGVRADLVGRLSHRLGGRELLEK